MKFEPIDLNEKTYVPYHVHSYFSNPNMVEVVNSPQQYIDKAVEYSLHAIAFSEHGSNLSWYKKKEYAEKNGLKYIMAVEIYVTMQLETKVRDNIHMILIAKNYEGFKEMNRLISTGYNRETNNFYYNPRITWDDIKNTSENIIITTACLGGIIWQLYKSNEAKKLEEVLNWFSEHKNRVFLEVQPHINSEDQKELNKIIVNLSKSKGIPLIAGSDTHALNAEYDKARKILQKSKKILFTNEDSFDLTFHSYDEFKQMFVEQGVLTEEQINEALRNTNVMANMCESWEVDRTKKYPQIYDNPEKLFSQKIAEGIKYRGIDKLPLETRKGYMKRIEEEFETYKANDAINYMLFEDEVKSYARSKGVRYGWGRGSVSGSIIAYLMQLTEMNSIDRNLNFARFMSKERISLADIDTDYSPEQRPVIQQYLLNHPILHCAHIVTYNKIEFLGSIRDMARGLDIPLDTVDYICDNVEDNEQGMREEFPELFYYVDLVQGTVTSAGSHACGMIVSPYELEDVMGTMTVVDSKTKEINVVTQINMKEIDAQNFVKLDLLGLDTVSIMTKVVDLVPELTWDDLKPENINLDDEGVWNSVIYNNVGIFQFESDFAHEIYKHLFNPDTIAKIREQNENVTYMDLLSLANAIIRPASASYRDDVINGNFYDNGHQALNEFLAPTLGRLVYQEQIIAFLQQFCGYSGGQADVIRRAVGKKQKETIDRLLPEIEEKFINTMETKYDTEHDKAVEIAKPFMQVIMDASDYGFSINHSDAYSFLTYSTMYLRCHYPLEFLTASLNVNKNKKAKTKELINYVKEQGIEIRDIRFGKSKADYMFSKEDAAIYQGIESIKFLNKDVGNFMYSIKDNKYETFSELLVEIVEKISYNELKQVFKELDNGMKPKDAKVMYEELKAKSDKPAITTRHVEVLIVLNFFKEFGETGYLMKIFEQFKKDWKNTKVPKSKMNVIEDLKEFESKLDKTEKLPLIIQCKSELEYLGHISTTSENVNKGMMLVTELIKNKNNVRAICYQFTTGITHTIKIDRKTYNRAKFEEGDVVEFLQYKLKNKNKKVNGVWKSVKEKELWATELKLIKTF